ncbi:hypothetical protein BVC80_8713g8 [Macleaya cordata]|uniref:Transmembrane protein n=1 Tax=Macleaya cordata TaxID=56857 RepID=A0A200QAC5_MACCD|nr:hypothetical protein BVC80_8713g8 [Macleaya cordata]
MVEVEPQLCSEKEIKPKSKSNLLMKPQIPVISISLFSSSVLFLSIFIILSLSFFHLSTNSYNLFKNTKFWFFISNVIVVIIAADSGVFSSSSKHENDLYEEFLKNSKTKSTSATITSSFIAKSPTKADGLSNTTLDKKPILQSDESAIFFEGKEGLKILCKTNSENLPEITQEKEIFKRDIIIVIRRKQYHHLSMKIEEFSSIDLRQKNQNRDW